MQTAVKTDHVTVEDYLAAETTSLERHEYLGGQVYAMSGTTRTHNLIALNLASALRTHLKGTGCQTFMSDIRVHLMLRSDDYYYYPDIVVTCDKRDTATGAGQFVEHPKLIIEVLSETTERVDKREKFFAYTQMASLEEYVLVSQTVPEVTLYRRANQWKAEVVPGAKATVHLKSLKLKLPLKAVYEGV
jgi:Uma2 family endonuclease